MCTHAGKTMLYLHVDTHTHTHTHTHMCKETHTQTHLLSLPISLSLLSLSPSLSHTHTLVYTHTHTHTHTQTHKKTTVIINSLKALSPGIALFFIQAEFLFIRLPHWPLVRREDSIFLNTEKESNDKCVISSLI